MKKLVLVFGLLTLSFALPVSAEVNISVVNVSQENADATHVGVRSGDVLRYEIALSGEGQTETLINLSDVLSHAQMVNNGGGMLNENMLAFPEGFCLTCDGQVFSFFVRANPDCISGETIDITFGGQTVSVPLHCELVDSGPGALIIAILALFLFMGYTVLSWRQAN